MAPETLYYRIAGKVPIIRLKHEQIPAVGEIAGSDGICDKWRASEYAQFVLLNQQIGLLKVH